VTALVGDGFRVLAAASQGDDARVQRPLRDMTAEDLAKLSETVDLVMTYLVPENGRR